MVKGKGVSMNAKEIAEKTVDDWYSETTGTSLLSMHETKKLYAAVERALIAYGDAQLEKAANTADVFANVMGRIGDTERKFTSQDIAFAIRALKGTHGNVT